MNADTPGAGLAQTGKEVVHHEPIGAMKPILITLLAGLAGLSVAAKEISYQDLTLTLDAEVTAETNAESGWLVVSWGRPDGHWSPLFLTQCPAVRYLAKTNAQDQIAQVAGICAGMQMRIFKLLPTLERLTAATNEVTLGSWKAIEVLVTASYRDRDYGTMKYACWLWAAGGKVWQAILQDGSDPLIAQARQIIGKIKLKPIYPPAATSGPQSPDSQKPPRQPAEPR
jgi:hypothetical protein